MNFFVLDEANMTSSIQSSLYFSLFVIIYTSLDGRRRVRHRWAPRLPTELRGSG